MVVMVVLRSNAREKHAAGSHPPCDTTSLYSGLWCPHRGYPSESQCHAALLSLGGECKGFASMHAGLAPRCVPKMDAHRRAAHFDVFSLGMRDAAQRQLDAVRFVAGDRNNWRQQMLARSDWLLVGLMVFAVILAVYGLGWFEASLECASSTSPHDVGGTSHAIRPSSAGRASDSTHSAKASGPPPGVGSVRSVTTLPL